MKSLPLLRFVLPTLLLATLPLRAEVKLPRMFSPHMVLQRGMAVPVWGTAAPGEKVEVKFRDQTKTATADKDGKWAVKLDSLKVGGPDVLTIGGKPIEDVLVGDVWIGSGQSNMDMTTGSYTQNDPGLVKIIAQTYPKLRLMTKGAADTWKEATPQNNAGFSAMLISFGIPLQQALDVPVGLMVGAVGGTPSGYWLSEEMYNADPAVKDVVKKFAASYDFDAATKKYHEEKAKYDADRKAFDAEMAKLQPEIAAAKAENKPGPKAPPAPRAPTLAVHPGEVEGGKIGSLFESYIRPYVGYGIKGVLWDQGESGTRILGVDQYTLMGALIKGWRKDWGQGDFPFLYNEKPSGGGGAWDSADPITAQANKFSALPATPPAPPTGDYIHATFVRLMTYPNTIMVTASDLGGGTHPINKSGYGQRGAQVALGAVYGEKREYLGPLYASHQAAGDKVTVKFTHPGKGLAFKNGDKLQGFAIAGDDKKWAWADAKIEGDTIVLSSKEVPKPVAVRYAWASSFQWANLFNQDGLPAQPFRTDNW